MKRTVGLCLAWGAVAVVFYAALLLLDCYWNLAQWRPRWDWVTGTLLAFIGLTAIALCRLSPTGHGTRLAALWTLLICLGLLAAGIYAALPEPLSEGIFGRESSSAVWYRGGRLLVMASPLVCWIIRRIRSKDPSIQPSKKREGSISKRQDHERSTQGTKDPSTQTEQT